MVAFIEVIFPMDRATASKVKSRYIVPIDEAELACRIMEAQMHVSDPSIKRPEGYTPEMALAISDPLVAEMARHAARAAMTYWAECISTANRTN